MRILIAGDTHNSIEHIHYLLEVCRENGIKNIIQLGDWGFTWPGIGETENLKAMLHVAKIHMHWIEGNHDNYTHLKTNHFFGANHLCQMSQNLAYIPRGQVFALGGVRFAALGGAVSIDRNHRIPGASWWPEEAITETDLARLEYWTKVHRPQVLITHDAPDLPLWHSTFRADNASAQNRKRVTQAAEMVQPDLLFHGHMHMRHTAPLRLSSGKVVRVEGLDCNGSGVDSWYILDTDVLRSQREV